ncbi:CoH2 [Coprinopsis cinerea okayama7|uniref:Hydrophobin n=1 Tax=Coprinopsis cinerea (strain Okayama-7 / 130 / ATCC MYA-4618 / FGSC 9003) TaxID=240176 RepID=A8NKH2_COPC7|nr:CoH2 [Coprinopsis cinerea okayama7\|eukprot:XP_001834449.1 CoH2 [Coprinopsis cinerea okayama7\
MQFKFLTTVALATLAVAVPTDPPPTNQCNAPNNLECCNSVQAPTNSGLIGTLLGLLNISVGDITGLVGLTCNPISLIGGGNSCNAQTVCCQNNHFGGLISIGCTPIIIDV